MCKCSNNKLDSLKNDLLDYLSTVDKSKLSMSDLSEYAGIIVKLSSPTITDYMKMFNSKPSCSTYEQDGEGVSEVINQCRCDDIEDGAYSNNGR